MPARLRLLRLSNALAVLGALGLTTCGNPAGPGGGDPKAPPPPPVLASLSLSAPAALVVQGTALITVTGLDTHAQVMALPATPDFSSSDPSIVSVTSDGVVKGFRRGRATVSVSIGTITATVSIRVIVRVELAPRLLPVWWGGKLRMATGDELQFSVTATDAYGVPLDDVLPAIWSSSDPSIASVSPDGLVVTRGQGEVTITAVTDDGGNFRKVEVWPELAGFPATIRFAHALKGVGPITFRPSKGTPVTLSYGESVERPILSGTLIVETNGFPVGQPDYESFNRFGALVRAGNRLSVFATGGAQQGLLVPAWDVVHRPVAPDSGLFRLVQGWNPFLVVYLVPTGNPPIGLPELCYFDPTVVSEYFHRVAGGFDVVLATKYGAPAQDRLHTFMEAGRAVTAVIAGDTAGAMELLLFLDP